MSRWFRFYDDAINNPKLLRLSDELYRAWSVLLCVASKNGGTLPPIEDIALTLRLKPAKVAEWITTLVKGGLLDETQVGFAPHNWNARQFKSDGSTERVKRFRDKQRNVSSAVSETGPEADSEQIQSRADARAVVTSSEKDLRSDLMEIFGAKCPDLARAGVWLSKGYAPAMIREVVRELISRKPDIANLAYFDAALAERHSKRAETPSERAAAASTLNMDSVVRLYALTGVWSRYAGPEPGMLGCRVPVDLLAKHGLGPDGQKIRNLKPMEMKP
jgi:hypothetical protein